MTLRVAIKVAYFNINNIARGFQIQPDVETIFSILQKAILKIGFLESDMAKIDYAGRTDHGVNALCQVIAFNLHEKWDTLPDRFLHRINAKLPQNIRCWAVALVSIDFHPRFNAVERSYHYIYTIKPGDMLALPLMNESIKLLIGTHNFVNFAKKDTEDDNFTRKINEITIQTHNNQIIFSIKAKSFLWQQCRRLTAHLVQIGKRQVNISYTEQLLLNSGTIIKPTPLPPENLILTNIIYENVVFQADEAIKLKIIQNIEEELYHIKRKEDLLTFLKISLQ